MRSQELKVTGRGVILEWYGEAFTVLITGAMGNRVFEFEPESGWFKLLEEAEGEVRERYLTENELLFRWIFRLSADERSGAWPWDVMQDHRDFAEFSKAFVSFKRGAQNKSKGKSISVAEARQYWSKIQKACASKTVEV